MDLEGTRLAVGEDGLNSGEGRSHVYELQGGTWQHTATLSAPDAAPDDNFGRSVALDGDALLVGAHESMEGTPPVLTGSAWLFRYDGTAWQQPFTSSSRLMPRTEMSGAMPWPWTSRRWPWVGYSSRPGLP